MFGTLVVVSALTIVNVPVYKEGLVLDDQPPRNPIEGT